MAPPSYIRPVSISEISPFLGDQCALCKQPFESGDNLVICPQDGSRHHLACWEANGNRCTAYGCEGAGEILREGRRSRARAAASDGMVSGPLRQLSKVRAMPSSSIGCAQSCLVISIALAILLIAAGCFGLWAVADYIMMELLGWEYRAPFSGLLGGSELVSYLNVLTTFRWL
jgi:hypothetical protein